MGFDSVRDVCRFSLFCQQRFACHLWGRGNYCLSFLLCFPYNPGNIARAFIMAVSRIVIGVMVPVLAFFIFFLGSSKEKDESAGAYAIRSAIHAAFQAAMLAGLFFFMRSLVNGDEVRNTRGETNFSESYFSRVFSNWWATFKKQSYSKEKASFLMNSLLTVNGLILKSDLPPMSKLTPGRPLMSSL